LESACNPVDIKTIVKKHQDTIKVIISHFKNLFAKKFYKEEFTTHKNHTEIISRKTDARINSKLITSD